MASCRNCRREIHQVLGVWRGMDWASWCGFADVKHEPEVVTTCSHCLATDHDWLGCVKLWTSPELSYGEDPISPTDPADAPKAKAAELAVSLKTTQRVKMTRKS